MIDETFHLTPLDVRRYEFGKALRGYDPERVNQFRDQVAEELERLRGELDDAERARAEQAELLRETAAQGEEMRVQLEQARAQASGDTQTMRADLEAATIRTSRSTQRSGAQQPCQTSKQ